MICLFDKVTGVNVPLKVDCMSIVFKVNNANFEKADKSLQ